MASPHEAMPEEPLGLRERRRRATRERILGVCEQLFRRRGFDETSIDDIVEGAGISRQTFFNYFSGKDGALAEIGLDWLARQGRLPRVPEPLPASVSVLAGMRAAVLGQAAAIEADREFLRLVFTRASLFAPPGEDDRSFRQRHLASSRSIFEAVAEVVRAGQRSGEIRPRLDAVSVAEVYVSSLFLSIRLWLTDYWGGDESLTAKLARALDVLEAGLRESTPSDDAASRARAAGRKT